MRIGVKPGQWGWSFDELLAAWSKAEAEGFDLLSCFDHASAAPAGNAAWDAPTLLAAMSGATSRIQLAVHVLNVSLRPPLLLAGQLAVAEASSRGRLEVGLGTGSWHLARHDHRSAGVPFPPFVERVRRLEACCRTFPALWRGETVTDDALGLDAASLGPLGSSRRPRGRRYERASPRRGGGIRGCLERLVRRSRPVRAAQAAPGGPPGFEDDRAAGALWLREVGIEGAHDAVARYGDAGADTIVFVLDEDRDPDVIARLAATVR